MSSASSDGSLDIDVARAEMLTEGYKGLLLINGGGAVALLAFLQPNWTNAPVAYITLVGIGLMGLGLFFASLVPVFRYFHAHAQDRLSAGKDDRRTLQWYAFIGCFVLSVMCFLASLGYLVFAATPVLASSRRLAQVPLELSDVMRACDQATAAKDAATWERLAADDLIVVLEDGVRRTKPEHLAYLKGKQATAWIPPQREQVKMYGNVAIQHSLSGDVWALVVWVKDANGWRIAVAQNTPAKK